MIVITGGAGFIGSNIVRALNQLGEKDILVVDHLRDGSKALNLSDCVIADYMDRDEFFEAVERDSLPCLSAVIHQGACSRTTETDGRLLMKVNFTASKAVFGLAQRRNIPLLYASSAAVYGASGICHVTPEAERPLNAYGWSKLVFDQFVRRSARSLRAPVIGLRYFNVYGAGEDHKGRMASVALHLMKDMSGGGVGRLFGAHAGVGAGEQSRDFVFIEDIIKVVIHFLGRPPDGLSILNVGTGVSRTFNDLARQVMALTGGRIEYVPFPSDLAKSYQNCTRADLTTLRSAGYLAPFTTLEDGVRRYWSSWRAKELIVG